MAGCIVLGENFMFPSFEIFGRTIGMYGVMTVIGAAFCVFVGVFLIKKFNIMWEDLVLVMIAAAVGILIVSHIVYGLTNINALIYIFRNIGSLSFTQFWVMIAECFGGMVFYGGFIGGALSILVFCKFDKKLDKNNLLDVYAVLIPLFHFFGRIGCFLGGCCYGIESEFGFTAHGNTLNPSINDVNRFPIQLVEAGINLLIFFFMLRLFKKDVMRDKLIYVYMLIYPAARFILEFFRGDDYRGFLFGLSTSQWISIILFVFSVIMLIVKRNKKPTGAAV